MNHDRRPAACAGCALEPRRTPARTRRVERWMYEGVLDAMQERLDRIRDAMMIRRRIVEPPFGTLKARMGARHFPARTLAKVGIDMSLQTLAYTMKWMIQIVGVGALISAIRG